jgi:glutathione S-transferase
MKLYMASPSGNSYKAQILLALLRVPYEKVLIDLKKQEHKQPGYLKVNPRGEVPALEDDGRIVWDSAACLVHIARKHGGEKWLPSKPIETAEVMQWLALSASEIQFGLQYGRRGIVMGRWTCGTLEECQAIAAKALGVMETRLQKNDWLALDRPTIADIACFPYVETAPEGKVALENYPAVIKWLERCRKLPGWPAR